MSVRWTILALAAGLMLGAFFATACEDESPPSGPGEGGHARFDTTPHGPIVVTPMDIPGHGTVLVDPDRFTLYVYDKDEKGKSNCNVACEAFHQPYTTGEEKSDLRFAEGLTGTIDLITRHDGSRQITYNGRPLYRSGFDKAPGDVNGLQPENGWQLATP
jgi:predicted lipoprotein with Yx(FWY)xxD motif